MGRKESNLKKSPADKLTTYTGRGKIFIYRNENRRNLIHKIQFDVYHLKLHFNMKRMVLISLKSNEK